MNTAPTVKLIPLLQRLAREESNRGGNGPDNSAALLWLAQFLGQARSELRVAADQVEWSNHALEPQDKQTPEGPPEYPTLGGVVEVVAEWLDEQQDVKVEDSDAATILTGVATAMSGTLTHLDHLFFTPNGDPTGQ